MVSGDTETRPHITGMGLQAVKRVSPFSSLINARITGDKPDAGNRNGMAKTDPYTDSTGKKLV
jgi:hypothetical protein